MKNQQLRPPKSAKSTRRSSGGRPRLLHPSAEMQRLAALLEVELLRWKHVTSRRMFGMVAVYRKSNIFALLPANRALDEPNSIGFSLLNPSQRILNRMYKDERIISHTAGSKWVSFALHSEADIPDALEWFALAYRQAGKS